MPRDLLEYHALETGELNRLWYEEHDVRARDAFQLRWWLGGDPIGGKDLLAHYHTAISQRCLERGILAEEHQLRVFEGAVTRLVGDFPADPIARFEDVLMPHVDASIAAVAAELTPPPPPTDAEFRSRTDTAISGMGSAGETLREWIDLGGETRSDAEFEAALRGLKDALPAILGKEAAVLHPLARTAIPPRKEVAASVATQHLSARQIFNYAHRSGDVSKDEVKEVEWCRACRELAVGCLLFLRQARQAYGGTVPDLPKVQPEFDADLQAGFQRVAPEVPQPRAAASSSGGGGSNKGVLIGVVVVLLIAAVITVIVLNK